MKTKLLMLVVAALVVWGLKRHYSDARADELGWILSPTSQLVGAATGTRFVLAPGEGYVSYERLFLIEKSCAGINFMAAAFLMLVVTRFQHVASVSSAARVLAGSLVMAYVAAVVVNAARIVIAMWPAAHLPLIATLTASQVHRLEGIVVYFGGLLLLYELARRHARVVATAGSRS